MAFGANDPTESPLVAKPGPCAPTEPRFLVRATLTKTQAATLSETRN